MTKREASERNASEQELVLQGFRAVLGTLRVPYAACPITGGPRFYDWLAAGADPATHADIVAANARAARAEVDRLRQEHGPIIDPTQVETVTSWGQADFHALWREVFHRHVSTLILLPGWELSVGCLKEANMAYGQGFPVVDIQMRPLRLSELVGRLRQTLAEIAAKNLPVTALAAELALLEA